MDVIQLTAVPLLARGTAVVALTWAVLAGLRVRGGMDLRTAIERSLAEGLIALGVVLVWALTLAPVDVLVGGAVPLPHPANLVPVLPLLGGLADVTHWRDSLANLGGNLLLFAPVGFGLRWRFGLRVRSILLIAAGASAAVEVVQALSDQMRYPDINDVILNALGAVAGAWAFIATRRLLRPRTEVRGTAVAGSDIDP